MPTTSATKMTVKIYGPLLKNFSEQIESLCIKRDAFMNKMISTELNHLAEDMAGKKNSEPARRFIAGELKRLGLHKVNMVIDKDVVDELNEIVERHNLVRDAFINRLLMFLRSSNGLLQTLDLPLMIVRSEFKDLYEEMPTSPLRALDAVYADPMYYIRIAAEERHQKGIYALDLPSTMFGFSCYLSDDFVPGTKDHAKVLKEAQEWLLEELEVGPLGKPQAEGVKS